MSTKTSKAQYFSFSTILQPLPIPRESHGFQNVQAFERLAPDKDTRKAFKQYLEIDGQSLKVHELLKREFPDRECSTPIL